MARKSSAPESARKGFEIIQVFHAAVSDSELDHGLEFFRDNGFFGIGEKTAIGCREQRGKVSILSDALGFDRISVED